MSFRNLLKAELLQFSFRQMMQPLAVICIMISIICFLLHKNSHPPYLSPEEILGAELDDHYSTDGLLTNIIMGLSLMFFLYQYGGNNILHRARLDGLSRADWQASINIQAFLIGSVYALSILLIIVVCELILQSNFMVYQSVRAAGYLVAQTIQNMLVFYQIALLGLLVTLFISPRMAPFVLLGWLIIELVALNNLDIKDERYKNIFLVAQLAPRPASFLWTKVSVSLAYITLFQLLLLAKTNYLKRYTTR